MNALVKQKKDSGITIGSFDELQRFSDLMAKSGAFTDVKTAAQAAVKIQYGLELGISPMAAIVGVHFVKGKPCLGATLIASIIKSSGQFDYKVDRLEDDGCTITFSEDGKAIGVSTFDQADAKKAGLLSDMYNKFPRNMYFARAMSNGARWYCANVFGGAPVYTPEEMREVVASEKEVTACEAEEVPEYVPLTKTIGQPAQIELKAGPKAEAKPEPKTLTADDIANVRKANALMAFVASGVDVSARDIAECGKIGAAVVAAVKMRDGAEITDKDKRILERFGELVEQVRQTAGSVEIIQAAEVGG